MLGCIFIGFEVPVAYVTKHFPTLVTAEGRGLLLVFASTFIFGNNPAVDSADRNGVAVLCDVVAIVVLICGAFCVVLWLVPLPGKHICFFNGIFN
jgi:hypothetical protein